MTRFLNGKVQSMDPSDASLMDKYGIIPKTAGVFHVGGYGAQRLANAVNYARMRSSLPVLHDP
jgi:hypothetical protein